MPHTLILGSPGAGKSTFAKELSRITGMPLVHLDMIYHLPDRTTVSKEEFDRRLMEVLQGEDSIIDGNYRRTVGMRLAYADRVFFFDLPTEVCVEGIKKRVGMIRSDIPWVEESLDPDFLEYVLNFKEEITDNIYSLLAEHPHIEKIIFHTREQAWEYLSSLEENT